MKTKEFLDRYADVVSHTVFQQKAYAGPQAYKEYAINARRYNFKYCVSMEHIPTGTILQFNFTRATKVINRAHYYDDNLNNWTYTVCKW